MGTLPYINNPFVMDRCDVAGVPINATRTQQFRDFQKTGTQAAKAYPVIRGLPGNNFGTPFAKGQAGDPVWKLVANSGYSPDSRAAFLGTTGFHASEDLGQFLTGTSDSPFCVLDLVGGFTVFGTAANVTGTHQITCSSWGVTYHNTNGLHHSNPKSDGPNNVTSRGRLSDAMVIRRDLIDAAIAGDTSLGHVLHMFMWLTDQAAGFCHPMTDYEQKGFGFGAEGERLRLKPSINLATRSMSPFGLAIARTLQQYGCYIGDNAGALSTLKAQQDGLSVHPWAGLSVSEDALVGITWDDFEVIEKGWQGNIGGGGGGGSTGTTVKQHKSSVVNAGTSCTATLDAPAVAGNLLVAVMTNSGNASNAVIPTGFTQLDADANTGGCNITIATKTAAGGETAITYTCGTASSRMILTVYEIAGWTALPTKIPLQIDVAGNSFSFGPISPSGLLLALLSLGTDATSSVLGDWQPTAGPGIITDEKQKTASVNNNVQQICGSLKQDSGVVTPSVSWTGTAVLATGFALNFADVFTPPPSVNAHYRYSGGAWSAVTRYRWSGSAWVATV